jgi:hypothetical protein
MAPEVVERRWALPTLRTINESIVRAVSFGKDAEFLEELMPIIVFRRDAEKKISLSSVFLIYFMGKDLTGQKNVKKILFLEKIFPSDRFYFFVLKSVERLVNQPNFRRNLRESGFRCAQLRWFLMRKPRKVDNISKEKKGLLFEEIVIERETLHELLHSFVDSAGLLRDIQTSLAALQKRIEDRIEAASTLMSMGLAGSIRRD